MDAKHDFVERILPYRLEALEAFGLALRFRLSWTAPVRMEIHFEGKLAIEGRSSAFTNPVIEAGVIHSRALLEFVGLRATSDKKLAQRTSRHEDDLVIEDFSNADGPLPRVTSAQALVGYAGPSEEAEHALAHVIHVANKGMAHSTISLPSEPDDLRLLEIASRGVPVLLAKHFYHPLGLQAPPERITARPRGPQ